MIFDIFLKVAHFTPLKHPYTAHVLVEVFMAHVFKLHGLPSSIVTDRDPIFLVTFLQELFKKLGMQLKMSSTHHPQSDGHTE